MFGYADRIGVAIAQSIVHAGKSGGAEVAQPGELCRRRLARKHPESISGRMPGEIHQDIDPVLLDRVSEAFIVQHDDVPPLIGQTL